MDNTISVIQRVADNKIFTCFFRTDVITTKFNPLLESWWISEDKTELKILGCVTDSFKILETTKIE